MVIKDFLSRTVFLDSAPLIYFIEGNNHYTNILKLIFEDNDNGKFSFITSSITLHEVLVKPLRDGKIAIADFYKKILLTAPGIEILELSVEIAEQAALLRAKYNLKTPDAIQLATAIQSKCDFCLTHDKRLTQVKEILVITLDDIEHL